MKSHSHIGFWITVFLVSIFVAPAVIEPVAMYQRLASEVAAITNVFGERVGGGVVSAANSMHGLFVTTGADDAVRAGMHNEHERAQAERNFSVVGLMAVDTMNGYFEGLSMQFYGLLLRSVVVALWLLLLLPFLAATLVDGVNARRVKLAELGYQNPTAFALASHLLIAMLALPLMYVAVPMAVPPTFMFWWGLAAALPLGFAISHTQPVLTR